MKAIAEQWKELSTPTISDALDRLGIEGQCLGIRAVDRSFRMAGRAFTIQMMPVSPEGGTVGDYVDDLEAGHVVVIANDGRMDATVWGDILTTVANQKGLAGTVIDGVCRDSARSLELDYPLFSRGTYMRTGKDRVQAKDYNVAVRISGIEVSPDDLLVGDADGVVVIPAGREGEVLDTALAIETTEDRIRQAVEKGQRLDEARKDHGYHNLQATPDKQDAS